MDCQAICHRDRLLEDHNGDAMMGGVIVSESDVMRVWLLRVFVMCGFLCFFENVSCFEERV